MKPVWLVFAGALAAFLVWRRRRLEPTLVAGGAIVAIASLVYGLGVVHLPNLEKLLIDIGETLGSWTYLLVGALAFFETGAFIGLIAPGETAMLLGGLVAGQGQIDVITLIAIVWAAATLGDLTSFFLGRRLGRAFLMKHGPKVQITEPRLEHVEAFFDKHGGKAILIGRFVGLVRAIAPFIAGASRMPLRKFLPYDILGAGLWATTFCVLGYVFWRSFDQLTAWVSRGLFAFGLFVAVVVAIVFLVRLQRNEELQAKTKAWISDQLEQPYLRPVAPYLRAAWRTIGRPAAHASEAPARFVWNRFTPGDLGLEVTTLLAIAAVGSFVFFLLADGLSERDLLVGDQVAADIVDRISMGWLVDVAKAVTALGSFVAVAIVVAATSLWAVARRRYLDTGVLVAAFLTTYLLTHLAKAHYDRPRPADALVDAAGSAFPSAHAAYSVAWIACAVVMVRTGGSWAGRTVVVTAAVILAAAIGLTRIYLRVHYLSDVEAGWGLGATVFALFGIVALVVGRLRHNEAPAA